MNCTICGNEHNGDYVHYFVGEDGVELVSVEEAKKITEGKRNPCWGFEPVPE